VDVVGITAIAAVLISLLSVLVIPYVARQRRLTQSADSNQVVSWQSITKAIQDERDKLKQELDLLEEEHRTKMRVMQNDYETKIHTMQTEYDSQMATANQRIRELESDVNRMAHQIYRLQNSPPTYPPTPGS
jgi:Skp family chaperone for outer membrane proteins